MTVPFERLGPGQVGRLAYQVIGKDGPIFNPSSISYLSPRDVQSSAFMSPTAAVAGLAGLNLVASVGAIAISAMVLREVRQVHRQLDVVEAQLTDLAVSLADVQARVQRIDTRVSETHLREALRHCLSSSVVGDGIDLSRLVPLITGPAHTKSLCPLGFRSGNHRSSHILAASSRCCLCLDVASTAKV